MVAVRVSRRPNLPPVAAYSMLIAGVYLTYAALRNVSPVAELRSAVSGRLAPARPSSPAGSMTNAPASPGTSGPSGPCQPPAVLVALPGNPGHRVAPLMATRFTQWVTLFGRPIPVSGAYRTCAQQDAGYQKDPSRFASAAGSLHPRGLAVDVNLAAIGANYFGNPTEKATYRHLWQTARTAGLYAYGFKIDVYEADGSRNRELLKPAGKIEEPWHFGTESR